MGPPSSEPGPIDFNVATGSGFQALRGELLSAAHCGPGGTVPRAVSFLPSVPELTSQSLKVADAVLLSNMDAYVRRCEALNLVEFARRGGGVFVFANSTGIHFPAALGGTASTTAGVGPALVVDPGSAITSGPFGSGTVCAEFSVGAGQVILTTPAPMGPTSVTTGQTWNFQLWYRDLTPGPASHFTDGVSVTFN